jgi:uncharacterized protein YbjT (DUF2867 family)
MRNYVIAGATGHIGNVVAKVLLSKGEKVKVIGRSADKLKELISLGGIPLIGNISDRKFLTEAFKGADAVFCLLTPDMFAANVRKDQDLISENYYEAVKINKVPNVILLSSVGAQLRQGAGIVDGLGYLEDLFLKLKDANVLNLRPSYFMENTFGLLGPVKQMGIAGNPVKGDVKFPIVATKDIGAVAAKRLLELNFKGNTVEYVLGPKDYSYDEITAILGKAINKPDLKFVQFPYEDSIKGMVGMGFCGEDAARLMLDLSKAINNGSLFSGVKRVPENTTHTTYEEFVPALAWVYNQN